MGVNREMARAFAYDGPEPTHEQGVSDMVALLTSMIDTLRTVGDVQGEERDAAFQAACGEVVYPLLTEMWGAGPLRTGYALLAFIHTSGAMLEVMVGPDLDAQLACVQEMAQRLMRDGYTS